MAKDLEERLKLTKRQKNIAKSMYQFSVLMRLAEELKSLGIEEAKAKEYSKRLEDMYRDEAESDKLLEEEGYNKEHFFDMKPTAASQGIPITQEQYESIKQIYLSLTKGIEGKNKDL
ncbi:hypothetical protein KY330_05130 [Candidatus Woesearchaeota archaeon]|nr:hypothetical protein [Candidatus Woesearchaeota archaeon]